MPSSYKINFYKDSKKGNVPVQEYINSLPLKEKAKVRKYIIFLGQEQGYLREPFCKHIKDEIWELRVDFARHKHRIFYFICFSKTIILLTAFQKHSQKTPIQEIIKAKNNLKDFKINKLNIVYE